MPFELISDIEEIETIAAGNGIRILPVLRERYGEARWRNLKGTASVRLSDDTVRKAEVHWFEAHRIGKKMLRSKRFLD